MEEQKMPPLPPVPAMSLDQFDPGERAVSILACERFARMYGAECARMATERAARKMQETATHLRDNSLSLAKYPSMSDESRARELAALYIAEIAALWKIQQELASAIHSGLSDREGK